MPWRLGRQILPRAFRRAVARVLRPPGRYVLVYHRVACLSHDPWGLAVSPSNFGDHLEVLRRYGPVMPLPEIALCLEAGTLPSRSVAITFDDGYADNLLNAAPLLDKHDTPATVYLAPGLLDGSTAFWWDRLTHIVLERPTLPRTLCMELGGEIVRWTHSDEATADGSRRSTEDSRWRAWQEPQRPEQILYLQLWHALRTLRPSERTRALTRLEAWAGERPAGFGEAANPSALNARDRPLSPSEASRLAQASLVTIGAHTMTHPSLPACDEKRRVDEVVESKLACEEISGQPVVSFSYPFGDHDARTVALARDAGFTSACTTQAASLRVGTDPFRIPRVQALDWTGAELERRLREAELC